ncbi:MAG: transglycosylase SLT domain-containing protein [Chloroflexota bacterium]
MNRYTIRLLNGMIGILLLIGFQLPNAAAQTGNALNDGNAALFNGDYAAAISAYTNAINDPASKCFGQYGLGVTYLRTKQYETADANFTAYLNECETSFRALVMRGEARQQLLRPADAFADYQQAIALKPGVLDSYLYERMASLDTDQSVHYLRLAAEAARQPEGKFALYEELAEVYLLVGSPTTALAQYNALLSEIDAYLATLSGIQGAEFDKDGSLRARIEFSAANIEIRLDQRDAGYARLQRIITNYDKTPSALPALVALVTAAQPVDLLARMRINVLNENYFPVVDILTDYLNDPAMAQSAPAELFLLFGKAQRGQNDLQGAIDTFGRIQQQFPSDPIASTAAYEQAQTYAQAGNPSQAVAIYTALVSAYPGSPEASDALLKAAEASRASGNQEQALILYEQLGQQYPTSEQAKQGLFEAGMSLRGTDPARAAQFLGRAGNAEGFVWQGKVLQQGGNSDAAQQAWQQAQAAEPGTFFALRGCELASGRDSLSLLPISPQKVSEIPDRAAAAQWVAQAFNLPGVSADLSPELAANPILQRGTELWMVGMWDEARGEFDALHKQVRANPAALLQLAFYYQTIPVYRSSIFVATRLIFSSNQPIFGIPQGILRLAFPVYYGDLLTQLSAQNNLDPLLVAALVRQESSFDPTNVSIADARGLMQLIPTTAQDVANQLAWPDYKVDDLLRPMVNLAFGTHYLSAMMAFQDGSAVGALLSYNAGPVAAQSWLNDANGDLDVLYQSIDFAETKTYLDVIYVNHFIYQYLYTDNAPSCGFDLPDPAQPTPSTT